MEATTESKIEALERDVRFQQEQTNMNSRVISTIQNLLIEKGTITLKEFRSSVKHNLRIGEDDPDFVPTIDKQPEQRPNA